jgi:hypothetical protein
VAIFVVATQWFGLYPWRLIYEAVPGAQAIRTVCRVGLLLLLPVGLGAALAVERLRRHGVWAAAALAALCLVEQGETTSTYDKELNRADILAVAAKVERGCAAFLYSPVNPRRLYHKYHLDAMWAGVETGVPTMNGYSGHQPKDWPFFFPWLRARGDEDRLARGAREWLASKGVADQRVCWIKLTEPR